MFKGSLLLPDSCTTPLSTKLHALTHPPSLLANWERLWIFDLDKSQVRGRYNCVREIRRSHCQPFCACVFTLAGVSTCLHPLDNCLVKIFFLLCVCFRHQRVNNSNIPELRGSGFSFYPFSMMLAMGLQVLRYIPGIPNLFREFIMKKCWILSDSATIEIIVYFCFYSVYVMHCVYWFVCVEISIHLRNEANTLYMIFVMPLSSVCRYCIESFCIYVY
jgi:hypothetical protein